MLSHGNHFGLNSTLELFIRHPGEDMPRRELKVGMSSAGGQKSIAISKVDWEKIETNYTITIGRELRDRIQHATQEFALGNLEVRAAPLVDAQRA